MRQRYKAELLLLLITFIWGGTFSIVKTALENVSPLIFLGIRFGISTVLYFVFFPGSLKHLNLLALKHSFVIAFFLFAGFAFQTLGLKYTTASKSGFITGMLVIFTPVAQLIIERKPPKIGNLIGIFLVTLGLLFLTSSESSIGSFVYSLGKNFTIGDFLTLLCAIMFALYIVYLDIYSRLHPTSALVLVQLATTSIFSFLIASLFEEIRLNFSFQLFFALIYTSLLATIFATYIQTEYQKFTTPTRAAVIFTMEPVFAGIIAWIFLNERFSNFALLGSALMLGGLLISELSDIVFKSRSGNFLQRK
ncbi:DMT family transporter [Candidatus Kryptobacter tengchongensis]|uniref:Permease of the drug/metabolite transporter (DMT) superfamily n=1 Tax=Kryptobacter tengchongensis TaxID=1643429 RepID=A0A916PB46_KRYT1|nr:DMT family transporter [Candidatus Kryptobacter tengchongensis]CUS98360.1 Permease of the drug/metabolite transporter (DMT) superfamily [Candidatus Kryptobacter tengchongensis]